MLEWYALVIPLIVGGLLYFLYKQEVTPLEILLKVGLIALVIVCMKGCYKSQKVKDVDYRADQIVRATYYEYWETWVTRTWSGSCGKNCHYTYDC